MGLTEFLVILLIIIIAVLILASYMLAKIITAPNKRRFEQTFQNDLTCAISIKSSAFWREQNFTLLSSFGYNLSCTLIHSDENIISNSIKSVIFLHSNDTNKSYCMKYTEMFYKRGFNIILYDQRACGNSGGVYTSMGYFEKDDLKSIITWVYEFFGGDSVIGLFGERMGASVALSYAAEDERLSFVIADSPYSDLRAYLSHKIKKEYNIYPFPVLFTAEFFVLNKVGYRIKDVSPIKLYKNKKTPSIPMLYIHSEDDTDIPPQMTVDLYNANKNSYKNFYLAPSNEEIPLSGNCDAFNLNNTEYEKVVEKFLKEINVI